MLASPGDVVVVVGREEDLEELQRACVERGDRACEIEPPHAHELLIEHLADAATRGFVQIKPVAQCLRIVEAQVLDVENREVPGLKDAHHLADGRGVRARERYASQSTDSSAWAGCSRSSG